MMARYGQEEPWTVWGKSLSDKKDSRYKDLKKRERLASLRRSNQVRKRRRGRRHLEK